MEGLNAVHMSLDEYIKVKGLDRQYEKPKEIFSEAPKKTDFKTRNKEEENDDDDDDDNYGDGDGDIFMKDSNEVVGLNYMKADFNDVYSKSLNENTSNPLQSPFTESKQWKNELSNVNGADDMISIVSRNSPRKQQFHKKNNAGRRYQKKNNNYGNKKQYKNKNRNRGQRQNNGNGNRNYRGGDYVKNYNNNQMQKSSEKTLPSNGLMTSRARALAMQKSVFKIQQQQQSSDSVQEIHSEESISQKLAVSRQSAVFNIEKMPLTQNNVDTFAGNFMNFLNKYENVVHKTVYDLQIQGKIAEMQQSYKVGEPLSVHLFASVNNFIMPTMKKNMNDDEHEFRQLISEQSLSAVMPTTSTILS